jgi:hypothetical protein
VPESLNISGLGVNPEHSAEEAGAEALDFGA